MRDPRKIIITEKGRERREDRFARDGQINIARCVARKSRTLQICRSVIASWYAVTSDPIHMQIRGVAREHSYWAVKYDLSINNVDRRRLCQNGAIRRSQASEIRNCNWLSLYGNL